MFRCQIVINTYQGTKTVLASRKGNGNFVSMKNATLTRLEVSKATAGTDTAL